MGEIETTPLHLLQGMLAAEVGKGFLLIWEALTGHEPQVEDRESKKREVLEEVFRRSNSR